ncbi:MAG: ABC transporter permease [Pseudomonadota bacterium]
MNCKIVFTRLTLLAGFFGSWQWGSTSGWLDPYFFGMPSEIFRDLWKMALDGTIFNHMLITLEEAFAGFCLGAVGGIAVAFALKASPFWAKVFDPIIMVLYGIPRISLAPLFILWFGLGMASKVVFAFILVFFLLFFNTIAGLKGVDREMVDAVRVMGASRNQILRMVILPAITPWILAGLKSGLGMSLLGAIVGEYIGGNAGLGWLINYAAGVFETNRVFSALLALAILVTVLNKLLDLFERRLLRWRPRDAMQ